MIVPLHSETQRVDQIFATGPLPDDIAIQGHWARYLAIIAAGFLENSIRIIFTRYADESASPNVASYVGRRIGEFLNPKSQKILEIVRDFNDGWATKLDAYWQGERKDAIDSIMNIRHNNAHGRDFGTSIPRIRGYYRHARDVVIFLHDQVFPGH